MTTKYDDMVWKILGGMPIEVFDEDDDTVWENETWELVKVRTEGDYKDSRAIGSANLNNCFEHGSSEIASRWHCSLMI